MSLGAQFKGLKRVLFFCRMENSRMHSFASCLRHGVVMVLLVSGCAKWDSATQAKLSDVSVTEPTFTGESYHKPDGSSSPNMAQAGQSSGLLGVLIGAAIDASVTGVQQTRFETKYAAALSRMSAPLSQPPLGMLQSSMENMLKADPFFATRVKEQSANQFTIALVSYGLTRTAVTDGHTRMAYEIGANITLKTADGKTVLSLMPCSALSKTRGTPDDYADKPEMLDCARREACDNIASQVRRAIDGRLGRKAAAK